MGDKVGLTVREIFKYFNEEPLSLQKSMNFKLAGPNESQSESDFERENGN